MPEVAAALRSYFGYHAFRPHQEAVVRAVLAGKDAFTVMPTGGGKSLCYQLPAVLLPGVCIVVSPLIALMKDQVDSARASGIRAAAFNSASSVEEKNAVRRALHAEALDLLYLSPERLKIGDFMEYLKQQRIAFFAIDEAHCISSWGHDFRPDYLALSDIVPEFPGVPVAAFTATATLQVESDIIARLGLRKPLLTRASFNRPNLFYQATPKQDLEKQLLDFLRERPDESGIIYRTTRKNVEATADFLKSRKIAALAYHAGLPDAERAAVQEAFRRDECSVIVATIAFGMGIDKSNVRFVVHADLPKTLEGYYQETGRAGRDGENARCALFYGRGDIAQLMRFIEDVEDPEARENARRQLFRMLDFTQREGCRRKSLLAYFNEEFSDDNCGACDVCTGEVEREDGSVAAQKLLSAMVRTGERFGARHIINIVLGKETKRIREFSHQELPTFGVGKDRDAAYWHAVMDALAAQGLTAVVDTRFPTPAVTAKGWEVLRGKRSCFIIRQAASSGKNRKSQAEHSPLFSLLREERMRLAKEAGLAPYMVFSDKSLREMVSFLPLSPDEFLQITGVGHHKLTMYGEAFLALIAGWLEAHPEDAARRASRRAPVMAEQTNRGRVAKGDSARETGRLLDQGMTLEEAARERGLSPNTLLQHLEQLRSSGKTYPPGRFMDAERMEWFRSLFAQSGSWRLGPVVALANESSSAQSGDAEARPSVSFYEARLARLLLGGFAGGDEAGEDTPLHSAPV